MALKDFLNRMGSNNVLCDGPNPQADLRSSYLMNSHIAGLEEADLFPPVGTQVCTPASNPEIISVAFAVL